MVVPGASSVTSTGTELGLSWSGPSNIPQHQTVPSDFVAHESMSPRLSEVTPWFSPMTSVGVATGAPVWPSPNCPLLLCPQHHTAPADVSAHVCDAPATTDTTPLSPVTSTGTLLAVVVPLPSVEPDPQHHTLPAFTAHE